MPDRDLAVAADGLANTDGGADAEIQRFLREAEEQIGGRAGDAEKGDAVSG